MRAKSCLIALLAACFALPCAAEEAPKKGDKAKAPKRDRSEEFFSSGRIPHIRIEINETNLAALKKDNRKYVPCTVRDGDSVYADVGIHLKGAAGSFRGLDDRPALTLNFDKFVEDQKYHGMDKLHLNNSVQDPSYMTEIICGEMFRAAGVPATRGGHARVHLNGRDLGLYVLKEGFDKSFLKRHFKNNKGNLYDGGFITDITEPIEKDSGEGDLPDRADLKALARAAQEVDLTKRFQRMGEVLDMERFISFVAMEVMTWHWDGYAMKKNNYRVYHDPDAKKLVFFPHGMDQMFWDAGGPLRPNMEGLVAQAFLQTPEGRQRYRARFGELFTNVFNVAALTNRVNELQARIRPALAAMGAAAAKEHDGQAQRLRDLIVQRAAFLQRQLSVPEPKPLAFDSSGRGSITGWRTQSDAGSAKLDRISDSGKDMLHIRATGHSIASWRATVLLDPGKYRLEGRVRTAGVAAIKDEKGEGAGLRISGSQQRSNHASGDTSWTELGYEFSLPAEDEVVLIAELRASKGEAWFDRESLKLVRVGR
jgi:spore coat protein H